MQEIWKDIVNYETLYQVSNYGNIKSYHKNHIDKQPIILKPILSTSGYYKITLHKNNKSKTHYIHRIVAEAFIPNPHHLPQVNHIDGIKTHNNITNLEWVSEQDNTLHAINMGLRPTHPPVKKGNNAPGCHRIIQYTTNMTKIKEWASIKDAAKHLGANPNSISKCLSGKAKTLYGYIWKYA